MWFRRLRRDQAATTAVEYGLIAALVAAGVIISVMGLGVSAETLFGTVPPLLSAFQGATGP